MTEEIRYAQTSAKAEIRSLERWYNTRRSQIMQELECINNTYYEQTSEINTKWAQYILELSEVHQEEEHKDAGPMHVDELATPNQEVNEIPSDDDLMAMESGIPRVDRPMTLSELATEPVAPCHNDAPMTLSELAIVSDDEDDNNYNRSTQMSLSELEMESEVDDDDESVVSVYNPTPRGVANLDLSDDEYDEYHGDRPSAVLYDARNLSMHLQEMEIHAGYDEVYSLESEDDDSEHPYVPRHVAIVSDDEDDHPEENNNEETEYDENAMLINTNTL